MRKRLSLLAVVLAGAGALTTLGAAGGPGYEWQLTPTGSAARLRGVSAISAQIAWTSGSLGTVLRTVDGGASWQNVSPPGTAKLQFRDIEAFDDDRAVILSIGPGTDSRIYVTEDGGQSWTLAFLNTDPNAFYACIAFFDEKRGLGLSDPVGGRFRIIATEDGGRSWSVVAADMPPALPAEFAFAASGQCVVTDHGHRAWFAAGGDFLLPSASPDMLASTDDGGTSWRLVAAAPNEYRSGAAWVTGSSAVVVGPTGSDASFDSGQTWQGFDDGSFDTVECAHTGACWASGEAGRVAF